MATFEEMKDRTHRMPHGVGEPMRNAIDMMMRPVFVVTRGDL